MSLFFPLVPSISHPSSLFSFHRMAGLYYFIGASLLPHKKWSCGGISCAFACRLYDTFLSSMEGTIALYTSFHSNVVYLAFLVVSFLVPKREQIDALRVCFVSSGTFCPGCAYVPPCVVLPFPPPLPPLPSFPLGLGERTAVSGGVHFTTQSAVNSQVQCPYPVNVAASTVRWFFLLLSS